MTVAAMLKKDEATIDDSKTWVKAMGAKGKWPATSAQYRLTALEAVGSMLASEDSHTARSVLENVDTLARDWATKNMKDGKTQKNYAGSVRSTLRIYLAYLEDPAKAQAQFDAAAAKPKKAKAKPESQELPLIPPGTTGMSTSTAAEKVSPRGEMRSYPLGDGRVVEFTIPEKFTTHDLAKLSCHLATYCADFDPTRPSAGVLSIARTDER